MAPHVAIAILNYNGKHYLKAYIPFVLASTYANQSFWVIDNASTDDSIAFLTATYPTINIILNKSNLGFAQGYNEGLATIVADYYVLLNSDAEVTPNFIQPIIKLMEEDATIAFAQPKLLDSKKRNLFEYAGAAGGLIDAVGYPFCRGRILETVEKDKGQYDDTATIFWASGCCLFARFLVYKELGGMYPYLYMQNEDIDLCWRAQNAGYKIIACSQSIVYHVGGGSLSWTNHKKVFYTFRNNLIMLTRNMPWQRLVWVLPVRLLIDIAAAFHYLFKKDWQAGKAVFLGQAAWLKWCFFIREKQPVKRGFKHYTGVVPILLVWQYFIAKRKTAISVLKVK